MRTLSGLVLILALVQSPPQATALGVLSFQAEEAEEAWTLVGTVGIEGHYARPHEVQSYRARLQHVEVPGAGLQVLDWTTWWTAEESPKSTTRVVQRGDGLWIDRDGVLELASDGESQRFGRMLLAFGERSSREKCSERFAHGRLGDVENSVVRSFEVGRSEPSAAAGTIYQAGVVLNFDFDSVTVEPAARDLVEWAIDLPTGETPGLVADREIAEEDTGISIRPFSAHVFEVLVPAWDSRVLVAEIGGGLAVLQATGDSKTGEAIVDALVARWPERPIRWVLPTHHHPYSMGGIRAFVAAGATVVTTPMVSEYVRELCARPFTLSPDRQSQSRSGKALPPGAYPGPLIAVVHDQWTLDDGRVRIEAYDIGERSRHTSEHLVLAVYDDPLTEAEGNSASDQPPAISGSGADPKLPRLGFLFHGDLGWHPDGNGGVRVGNRSRGLIETIDQPGPGAGPLAIARIVQSWPVADVPAWYTVEALRVLLPPE